MSDVPCLLILHIPKTAGTSFRVAAINAVGVEACQFDYGRLSPDTTDLVRAHVYGTPDLYRFANELEDSGARLLAGHFDLSRYGALFRSDQVLSFCREPRQQLASHYAHAVRHNGYAGTLAEFLASSDGGGRQSRAFGHVPIEALGFVGVTERYEESLRVVREAFGLDVQPMVQNVNPGKAGLGAYEIPDDELALYDAAAERDADVYARANRLLDQRLLALDAKYLYVHGMIQNAGPHGVRGFAFDGSEFPVEVEVEVNGRPVSSANATNDRPGLRAMLVPRHGFVGFDIHKRNMLQDGDHLAVKVASSGQVLGEMVFEQPNTRKAQP